MKIEYEWHDAKNDPPKENGDYLVSYFDEEVTDYGVYEDGQWFRSDGTRDTKANRITYWTEYPKPPRGEDVKVMLIKAPKNSDLVFMKQCVYVTMGKRPKDALPSSELITKLLAARHSPIRVLNYGFMITNIPSNTATHLARHVHAVPFISSLRNDRQDRIDGDKAPRDTPVDMIFYCNAEELMNIANKRLCNKAAVNTRSVVMEMCEEAAKVTPELGQFLVPMCMRCGGVCYEPEPCGRYPKYDGGKHT